MKRWKFTVGPHGAKVTAMERKAGGPVYLLAFDANLGGYRKRSLKFGVRDAKGKLVREATKKAEAKALELSNRLLRGEAPAGRVTVRELIALFRRERIGEMRERHRDEMKRELDLLEHFLGPSFPVANLGLREWGALRRERASGEIDGRALRVTDEKKRQVAGPRTVAKTLKALRQLCRFGANYRRADGAFLLERDPTSGLPIPVEKNPARPLASHDRFERLVAKADQVRMRVGRGREARSVPSYLTELLILAEGTGRRISAILALRYSDWRPNEGPYGSLRWRADSDKVGRDWVAPVGPGVRDAIERIRRDRPGVGDAWLFPSPNAADQPLSRNVATDWLRRAEKLAEMEPLPGGAWHPFRRLWATARKHLPVSDVAAAGGWVDTTTLLKSYQRVDAETLLQVVLEPRKLRESAG
ncbi:MAG: tyrosine-type recombinase/integrase [Gemmatimonadetes bacterium]|nr:tyrosine-type recombinase/integrase [Gemmatimonadota bacterium]